jgi:hypothetical protein
MYLVIALTYGGGSTTPHVLFFFYFDLFNFNTLSSFHSKTSLKKQEQKPPPPNKPKKIHIYIYHGSRNQRNAPAAHTPGGFRADCPFDHGVRYLPTSLHTQDVTMLIIFGGGDKWRVGIIRAAIQCRRVR